MKKLLLLLMISLSTAACADSDTNAPNENKPTVKKVSIQPSHAQGKSLHDEKCTTCHQNEVYTREDRMVKTMMALEHQVNNCMKGPAKAEWTQPETTSVVEFLNDRYYKF